VSDATAARVDDAVSDLLKDAEDGATELLVAHRERLAALIARLEEKETLGFTEIRSILDPEAAVARRSGPPPAIDTDWAARLPRVRGERR
jgi:cell division protease FtsH